MDANATKPQSGELIQPIVQSRSDGVVASSSAVTTFSAFTFPFADNVTTMMMMMKKQVFIERRTTKS